MPYTVGFSVPDQVQVRSNTDTETIPSSVNLWNKNFHMFGFGSDQTSCWSSCSGSYIPSTASQSSGIMSGGLPSQHVIAGADGKD